ncbi:MAG: UvrB/UvrC motif-containing protein [Planctomycetota bacterium]
MSHDVSHILDGWDFDPHELNVRVIAGDDGTEKIQMRIDLGLLQMNVHGRPDGEKPFGCESLLDYYEAQAKEYGQGYSLSSESADQLFREGWQYYQRYLCLFHLGYYEHVIRDTERNLRLFRFVKAHSKKRREQLRFDQYRPYVIMMQTRAKAMLALNRGDRPAAMADIEAGCHQIEAFLKDHNKASQRSECFELEFLTRWYDELKAKAVAVKKPAHDDGDELTKLRDYLQKAVDREDYEYAALLRDQIKRLEQPG